MITHRLDFGQFNFHENTMVGEFAEGVNFDLPMLETLGSLAQEHFTRPFGYVANRVHSYSIDPRIYQHLDQVPLMRAFAVVTYRTASWQALQMERGFMPKMAVGCFFDLTVALNWVERVLREVPQAKPHKSQP